MTTRQNGQLRACLRKLWTACWSVLLSLGLLLLGPSAIQAHRQAVS
jgi:hypothetical protein